MKTRVILATLSFVTALALGCAQQSRMERESREYTARNTHLGQTPRGHVVTPPNGQPFGAMSTNEEDRIRVGYAPEMRHAPEAVAKNEPAPVVKEAPIQTRSAAPAPVVKHPKKRHAARSTHRSTVVAHRTVAPTPSYIRRMTDAEALNRVHHANQVGIELATMAEQKATTPALVTEAHQMKADFERRETEVVDLANKRNITLENFQLATYEVAVKHELEALDKNRFEPAYKVAVARAHSDAIHDLTVARNEVRDREIKTLIGQELPTLQAKRWSTNTYPRASSESGNLGH